MAFQRIGIVGGSGLGQALGQLTHGQEHALDTPFGKPSATIVTGELSGVPVALLARHGAGHVHSPTHVPYRANIFALKTLGVTHLLCSTAVGSLREEIAPRDLVIPDQLIDKTFRRATTFFDEFAVHAELANPFCSKLRTILLESARATKAKVHDGATLVVMEGPQFSTKAESELYRSWGCSVIGMTNMPEAKLAREAELCYATVAMVTDFDCWHPDHDHVTVEAVVRILLGNAGNARNLVRTIVPTLGQGRDLCPCGCDRALDYAVITAADRRDAGLTAKLDAVAGRVL